MTRTYHGQMVTQSDTAKQPKGAVSVGTSDTLLVAANPYRVELTITNDHATQIVWLAFGATAEVSKGIRLNAAGGADNIGAYTGAVRAIASGPATNVTFSEV